MIFINCFSFTKTWPKVTFAEKPNKRLEEPSWKNRSLGKDPRYFENNRYTYSTVQYKAGKFSYDNRSYQSHNKGFNHRSEKPHFNAYGVSTSSGHSNYHHSSNTGWNQHQNKNQGWNQVQYKRKPKYQYESNEPKRFKCPDGPRTPPMSYLNRRQNPRRFVMR